MKKPKKNFKNADGLSSIITMTAGFPKTPDFRTSVNDFSRKPVEEIIVNNPTDIKSIKSDQLIETVRLAPSAVNLQPWLIEKINNKYNFYIRSPKGIIEKMINDMRHIDIGIAMAHLFVQAKADGSNVSFSFEGTNIKQGKFIASLIIS